MSEQEREPMGPFEMRLATGLVTLSQPAVRRVDAKELAAQLATDHPLRSGLAAVLRRSISRRLVLVVLAAVVAATAIAIAGSRPPRPAIPYPLAYSDDAGAIFLRRDDGSVQLLTAADPASNAVTLIQWSSDHRELALLLTYATTSVIAIYDTAGTRVGSFDGYNVGWSPDGQHLAIAAHWDRPTLQIVDLDGGPPSNLRLPTGSKIRSAFNYGFIRWSPDGRWLAATACTDCSSSGQSRVLLVATDGSGSQWLTPESESSDAAWSADGSLAWVHGCGDVASSDGCDAGLTIRDPNNVLSSLGLTGGGGIGDYAWSPDGRDIAIISGLGTDDKNGLWIGSPGAVPVPIIVNAVRSMNYVRWAADGQTIEVSAFSGDGSCAIWSVARDSGVTTKLVAGTCEFDGRDK